MFWFIFNFNPRFYFVRREPAAVSGEQVEREFAGGVKPDSETINPDQSNGEAEAENAKPATAGPKTADTTEPAADIAAPAESDTQADGEQSDPDRKIISLAERIIREKFENLLYLLSPDFLAYLQEIFRKNPELRAFIGGVFTTRGRLGVPRFSELERFIRNEIIGSPQMMRVFTEVATGLREWFKNAGNQLPEENQVNLGLSADVRGSERPAAEPKEVVAHQQGLARVSEILSELLKLREPNLSAGVLTLVIIAAIFVGGVLEKTNILPDIFKPYNVAYAQEVLPPTAVSNPTEGPGYPGQGGEQDQLPQLPTANTTATSQPGNPGQGTPTPSPEPTPEPTFTVTSTPTSVTVTATIPMPPTANTTPTSQPGDPEQRTPTQKPTPTETATSTATSTATIKITFTPTPAKPPDQPPTTPERLPETPVPSPETPTSFTVTIEPLGETPTVIPIEIPTLPPTAKPREVVPPNTSGFVEVRRQNDVDFILQGAVVILILAILAAVVHNIKCK